MNERQQVRVGLIGPHYFETAGISLVQGRELTEAEIVHTAHFAVANEELSKRYFASGAGPIGARIQVPGLKISQPEVLTPPQGDQWFEIVGVAATASLSTTLFTVFAAVGLLLAAMGLYSVVAYTVAQRTHEVGIRMALGAQRSHILRLVTGSMMALIGIGTAAGLAVSIALSRFISRVVEGWNARDPVAFVAVAAELALTGLAACWLPARRATAIDPMKALRQD